MSEFGSGVGEIALTGFQKRLAQNYFTSLDKTLNEAEAKRLKKEEKYRDKVALTWQNVDMEKLAPSVVAYARMGLDPAMKNHINMIPFKNSASGKYDIGFIEGYVGLEIKAKKYALDPPDFVIVQVVRKTDTFKSIKRDINHAFENYVFDITNEFERGDIVGGFYYYVYSNEPEKNKLVVMNLKDIEKRKPDKASAEFWGGEKDVYKNGVKTGAKETVEGWYEEMVEKTIKRAAYGSLPIDSQKIDTDYMHLKQVESSFAEMEAAEEIKGNANGTPIDIEHGPASDDLQDENEEPGTNDEAPPKSGPNF
jgi:recombination protein RecT